MSFQQTFPHNPAAAGTLTNPMSGGVNNVGQLSSGFVDVGQLPALNSNAVGAAQLQHFAPQQPAAAHMAALSNTAGSRPAMAAARMPTGMPMSQKPKTMSSGMKGGGAMRPVGVVRHNSAQQRTVDAAAAAKRLMKKKKLVHEVPVVHKSVIHHIPESEFFTQLVQYEKQIDKLIARRKAVIRAALAPLTVVKKKLRVYVYNTHANQPQQSNAQPPADKHAANNSTQHEDSRPNDSVQHDAAQHDSMQCDEAQHGAAKRPEMVEPPSWCLVVYGREVSVSETDDNADAAATDGASAFASTSMHNNNNNAQDGNSAPHSSAASQQHPFTFYIRKIEVWMGGAGNNGANGGQHGNNDSDSSFVWLKDKHDGVHHDSIEIHQLGSANVAVKVTIHPDWGFEHYKIKENLARVVTFSHGSRSAVLAGLWKYIQLNKMQDPNDPSKINLEERLQYIFDRETITTAELPDAITPFLTPMEPIVIDFTVKVDGPSPTHPICYDIDVELPVQSAADKLPASFDKLAKEREVAHFDQSISNAVRKLQEHDRKRKVLLGFAQAPTQFVNTLVASQMLDLRSAKGDNGRDFELLKKSEFFKGKWTEDAVTRYLQRRMAGFRY